jgi:group I intron endonuclease
MITFPNNKVYIGYTSRSLKERLKRHNYDAFNRKTGRTAIMNAIRKFTGKEVCFVLEVVDTINIAHEREIAYIAERDSTKPEYGYNISRGGDGVKHTPYTKAKISKGAIVTNKRRFADSKNIKRQSEALSEYWAKEGTKLKASIKRGGKPFLVTDKNTGKLVGEWQSQRGCAKDLGISPSVINNCLKGRRTHCGNYIFNFKGK